MRNARVDHHPLRADLRRKIAFMADSNHFFVEAQRKKNFRGRRQKRNNSHGQTLPQQREDEDIHLIFGVFLAFSVQLCVPTSAHSVSNLLALVLKFTYKGNIFDVLDRKRPSPKTSLRQFFQALLRSAIDESFRHFPSAGAVWSHQISVDRVFSKSLRSQFRAAANVPNSDP